MKVMKFALLGTAALAAVSVSARADNLSDLKAQIEALNARVASLETAPALPAGYQMVSLSKGAYMVEPGSFTSDNRRAQDFGDTAHLISIMPTADMPASTVISWSGYVRAAVVVARKTGASFSISTNPASATVSVSVSSQYGTDIRVKAGLSVSGKTDTAVGEVGVNIGLQANAATDNFASSNAGDSAWRTDGATGYWKLTPNLTLLGGYTGSVAKNSKSWDANCTCYYGFTNGISNNPAGDPAQMRLTYADGPLSLAVAVEDSNNLADSSAFGVAAKGTYAADMFSVDLSGGYWGNANGAVGQQAAWVVDAGVGVSLGSVASFNAAVGVGAGFATNSSYTIASGLVKVNLAETAHAEAGIEHKWNTSGSSAADYTTFGAGVYYDPVKQLTIGLEGQYISGGTADGSYGADLVTVFRF